MNGRLNNGADLTKEVSNPLKNGNIGSTEYSYWNIDYGCCWGFMIVFEDLDRCLWEGISEVVGENFVEILAGIHRNRFYKGGIWWDWREVGDILNGVIYRHINDSDVHKVDPRR